MTRYGSERVFPYNEKEQKGRQVKRMFDHIAPTYDRLNHTLSFGIDKGWRKQGIAWLAPFHPQTILDIATGTGDLAIALQQTLGAERVVGADLSEGMMAVGRRKAQEAGVAEQVSFECQDCLALSYPAGSFDAVTAAFGVRNFEDIAQGLREMYRVLKPGGHLMILELSTPERFPMRQLYRFYSQTVIPWVGRLISKEEAAYSYLPASVRVVPQGEAMVALLSHAGFREVAARRLTFGICSLYTGTK